LVGREKAFVLDVIFMRKSVQNFEHRLLFARLFADRAECVVDPAGVSRAKFEALAGIDADRIEKLAADKFVANDRIVCGLDILLEDNCAVASGIETVAFNKSF
jgi:hypothetical protein